VRLGLSIPGSKISFFEDLFCCRLYEASDWIHNPQQKENTLFWKVSANQNSTTN
jgi:hypothetical protein